MKVFRSNRAEVLARALTAVLARPVGGPFDEELVVVHSPGMARWLTMRIAEEVGICAHVRFPHPGRLLNEVVAAASEMPPEVLETWSVDRMRWAVLAALPALEDTEAFGPVHAYLKGDLDGRMRMQLAGRVAEVFGRYLAFRPDMLRDWTEPQGAPPAGWQPRLFRALAEATAVPHPGALAPGFFQTLQAADAPLPGIPERICLFGISTLAPATVEILDALSRHHEVFLFVLAPTQVWASHTDHPLLHAMGKLGRDFQWVLEQHGPAYEEAVGQALFVDPLAGTDHPDGGAGPLLWQLQSDILQLRSPGTAGQPQGLVTPSDRSVRLHSCHGPMRQVEVLHDELLRLFDTVDGLRPRDVVVMCPDLPTYAPLVEAVFARHPDAPGPPPIPFRLADRALRRDNPVAEAVLAILELARGRLPASAVLDVLALAPVRDRFGLDTVDLDTVRAWIRDSGVRWGRDADHRVAHGQPLYTENTWRFGLDRLLVGSSMRGDGRRTFAGVLPYDEIEGGSAELLGKLVGFWEVLSRCLDGADQVLSPAAWQTRVLRILDRLLAWDEDHVWQAQQVRDTVDQLAAHADAAGYTGTFGLTVLLDLLTAGFGQRGGSAGFLSGGVTVCAMVPLRAIPFRVVVLLGLDDGSFPRRDPALGFDLSAQDRRRGDRSPRDEDRHLFLESLLSARDAVVITWTGRSVQTGEALPPAVPVGELLDLLLAGYRLDEPVKTGVTEADLADLLRAHLLTEHPLQAFSPSSYAPDPRRQSFEPLYLESARRMLGKRVPEPPFVGEVLPSPPDEEGATLLSLDDLVAFLSGPVRWLLNRRLGIWLRRDSLGLEDREPAELNGLERYQIGTVLLDRALDGQDLGDAFTLAQAAGVLPPGTPGRTVFEAIRDQVLPIAARTRDRRGGDRQDPVDLDVDLGNLRLVGRVGERYVDGPVLARFGRVSSTQLLGQWVRHLALCAAGHAEQSWFVGRGKGPEGVDEVGLRPVAQPKARLRELVELFALGQDRPLPLFGDTSRAYVEALRDKPDEPEQAERSAAAAWANTWTGRGDGLDPHVARVFGDTEPFRSSWDPGELDLSAELRFAALSQRVWGPLLDHLEETP